MIIPTFVNRDKCLEISGFDIEKCVAISDKVWGFSPIRERICILVGLDNSELIVRYSSIPNTHQTNIFLSKRNNVFFLFLKYVLNYGSTMEKVNSFISVTTG